MKDVYYFENLEQIRALREPTRWKMLNLLIEHPMTGSQLARVLGITRPLAHYHLKVLEKVGLVEFLEDHVLDGVVEKYYQALARQYRSDRLVDRYRTVNYKKNGETLQTGEVVGELMKSMIEVAKSDISNPESYDLLAKIGFNFQDELHLTAEQANELIRTLRALGEKYIEIDKQNLAKKEEADARELIHLRYTWLITPVLEPHGIEDSETDVDDL
jgi:DNA-binding transcriptional ArsR family regulator